MPTQSRRIAAALALAMTFAACGGDDDGGDGGGDIAGEADDICRSLARDLRDLEPLGQLGDFVEYGTAASRLV